MSAFRELPTVLVADDDEDDRRFITRAWGATRAANELRFVEDGQQLTDYLNREGRYSDHTLAPLPWLILLDLNMPKKGGREVLSEIKADPKLRKIPVVVLSTSNAKEDISRSFELGANSYITKPRSLGALAEVLEVLGRYWIDIVNQSPEKKIGQLIGFHSVGDDQPNAQTRD